MECMVPSVPALWVSISRVDVYVGWGCHIWGLRRWVVVVESATLPPPFKKVLKANTVAQRSTVVCVQKYYTLQMRKILVQLHKAAESTWISKATISRWVTGRCSMAREMHCSTNHDVTKKKEVTDFQWLSRVAIGTPVKTSNNPYF